MEIGEAIRTTGAVRRFTDEPVDDATVHALLDDARFAPSGGNSQSWRVAVVKDRGLREQLARLMEPVWDEYVSFRPSGITPFNAAGITPDPAPEVQHGVPNELLDHIADIPVVLVIAADLSLVAMMDRDLDRKAITGGGSIYPFCWNLLLAARSRGLGGVLTTFLARAEPAAAPLLDLPPNHAIAGMVFKIAKPDAPRWISTPLYIALGWAAVVFIPQWIDGADAFPKWVNITVLTLVATGGILYTLGGLVYAAKKPDPSPEWFGFHEIFHSFTVAAFICQYVAVSIATYQLR